VSLLYLDTSALAKLVHPEAETAALTAWIARNGGARRVITSDLGHTELRRMLHRIDASATELDDAAQFLAVAAKIRLTASLLVQAGELAPGPAVRSLDAIHTAAAKSLGAACRSFITYDERQAEAARLAGLAVVSPC
jgi:predicted nucleic acid-binding protein